MSFLKNLAMLFRLVGDICHVYSMIILAQKIKKTRSCSGLSYKTQYLFGIVFYARYIDLFKNIFYFDSFLRVYNNIMKILYLSFQSVIIYLIRFKYFYSIDKSLDNVDIRILLIPSAILAFPFKPKTFSFLGFFVEYFWTFSVFLESVAILPQLIQLQESGESETLTSQYIFFLGVYRIFYLIGWIFKFFGKVPVNHLLVASAILQGMLYTNFFVLYYKHIFSKKGKDFKLGK
ncbi:ER lumen protein-retaining receptor [Hamiltosporidium tvaerminnensis]|uniref:ER lumen protein-retaining receptor n=1 Tax=Hamiltosporidium tvaerminnensis TaxID=1176355 RepID=A0A4Q9L3Y3_9MICR|nr:endoplasmic reticulum retention protein [Hamiltosporidium tvaerminnensis]TBU01240.1 ER lumen protein-retaining receptor [Hamiltosporidium tvaerminnensis]